MNVFAPRGAVSILFACVAVLAAAQNPGIQFSGTLENYYQTNATLQGAQHRITWMQLVADVNPHLRFVAGQQQRINANSLDETYAQVENKGTMVRAGVMRSAFGFSDWAEQYYSGLIAFPMVRGNALYDNFSLLRLDTGVQVSGGSPNLQYQIGLVDVNRSSRQFFPDHMDHGVVRLQTFKGSFIFGLSGLQQVSGLDPSKVKVYGLDVRWTAPQIQIRAEADKLDSDDPCSEGYYLDVFYRPGHLTKTRLLGRIEAFKGSETDLTAKHYALGLRQVLNENFTLSINYGFGNHVSPAPNLQGWSAQLMTSLHF